MREEKKCLKYEQFFCLRNTCVITCGLLLKPPGPLLPTLSLVKTMLSGLLTPPPPAELKPLLPPTTLTDGLLKLLLGWLETTRTLLLLGGGELKLVVCTLKLLGWKLLLDWKLLLGWKLLGGGGGGP